MTLPRGFKAQAERQAAQLRSTLGLGPEARIDINELARKALNFTIIDAAALVPFEQLEELETIQAFSFSAAMFDIAGRKIIVTNPLRSPARRNSDIAHEISHVLLEHELSEIRYIDDVPFRTCLPDQEEEATTLGGTVLLPRQLLLASARRNPSLSPEQVATEYDVTVEMARFRLNSTGVLRQTAHRRHA